MIEELCNEKGIITDIKRFAVHDGPGLRTTIFFKGCPLHCIWCQNPETIKKKPEIAFYSNRCIRCEKCVEVCTINAHKIIKNGKKQFDRNICKVCGRCVENCPANALDLIGKKLTVYEVMEVIYKDKPFYKNSGGGITLSGGEPAMQPEFAVRILKECKQKEINTAIDTSGHVKWEILEMITEYVDLILYDIKHMNPLTHKEYTGVSNSLILNNLKRLIEKGKSVEIRVPIIPGYNDSKINLEETITRIKNLGIKKINFLPYNVMSEYKYRLIGMNYRLKDIKSSFSDETSHNIKDLAKKYAIEANIEF